MKLNYLLKNSSHLEIQVWVSQSVLEITPFLYLNFKILLLFLVSILIHSVYALISTKRTILNYRRNTLVADIHVS